MRPFNLSFFIGWRALAPGFLAAAVSGLLLSAAFSPLEWSWTPWIGLIPVLAAPIPRRISKRVLIGYGFGLFHFMVSLYWLNEVGFFAGYLLAVYCGLFFLAWYLGFTQIVIILSKPLPSRETAPKPAPPSLAGLPAGRYMAAGLFAAAMWVGVEWIRSWLFTGFPWNQLGLSQWCHMGLLQVTTFTGVYGLSFLLVIANTTLLWIILAWRRRQAESRFEFPWPVLTGLLLFLPVMLLILQSRNDLMPPPHKTIRIAAVQGNIPQMRVWTQSQLDKALRVYDRLSREAARENPDLLVWPETAVPAPAFYNEQYSQMLQRLSEDIRTPLLFGNIHAEPVAAGDDMIAYNDFNSVFLLDENGKVRDYYYKVRLVPFGEYVPMGGVFPFLHNLIGMGRDLTAGRELTLFELQENVWAGVNICFEDVFSQVSRKFVLRGANLLMTLTNDAWFAESSGSRQHMLHAVLRAVENRRPLLRSGNNSDTALIMPDGRIRDLLYDHESGNRFIRDWHIYTVPIWFNLGTTFYSRHGDLFAYLCSAAAAAVLVAGEIDKLYRRRRFLQLLKTGHRWTSTPNGGTVQMSDQPGSEPH